MRTWRKWVLGVSLGLVLLCLGLVAHAVWPFYGYPVTTVEIRPPAPLPSAPVPGFVAGVGVRDITPPVVIPKMGYSAWAREANGFRTRLKTRAFYLRAAGGPPLVVLQADLPAASLMLQREVAARVARTTDVAVEHLSLHVTHTHSGPGQYMSSDFYNSFGSNRAGFDPRVFDFLASQMAAAVEAAYHQRRPARLAIGSTDLYGATRNRAMGAYVRNHNVSDKQTHAAAALRAVNPRITLVRLDARTDKGDYRPLGAFSTFAIHGTGIPPFSRPYHGDVWAFFERELEARIRAHYDPPWTVAHGPFEANHGDNNPNFRHGMRGAMETRRLGLMLAEKGWELFRSLDQALVDEVTLVAGQRELDLLQLSAERRDGLCPRAIAGTAVVGSAQDDEVFPMSYLPPFQRGWPDSGVEDCHGAKRWMLSRLQAWGLKPGRYPHRLAINAFQINELLLVGLPFEVTFEAGNRIAAAVEQAAVARTPEHVVISSHSNGFFGYATTAEEYGAQWYEGGHTLYGPQTTPFLAREAARVVSDLLATPERLQLPAQWRFQLRTARYFPPPQPAAGQRLQIQAPAFTAAAANQEPYWETTLLDVNPGQLQLHRPLLSIEVSADGEHFVPLRDARGEPVDDQGADLQLMHLGPAESGMARYALRWYHPPVATPGQWFCFRVAARDQQPTFYSSAFR